MRLLRVARHCKPSLARGPASAQGKEGCDLPLPSSSALAKPKDQQPRQMLLIFLSRAASSLLTELRLLGFFSSGTSPARGCRCPIGACGMTPPMPWPIDDLVLLSWAMAAVPLKNSRRESKAAILFILRLSNRRCPSAQRCHLRIVPIRTKPQNSETARRTIARAGGRRCATPSCTINAPARRCGVAHRVFT